MYINIYNVIMITIVTMIITIKKIVILIISKYIHICTHVGM